MKSLRLDMYKVLRILKCCGTLMCTWPPNKNAGRKELFLRDFFWSIFVINLIFALTGLALSLFHGEGDITMSLKTLSEITAAGDTLFNLILCRIGRSGLQNIFMKIEKFLETATEQEKFILSKCINRYSAYASFVSGLMSIAFLSFTGGPIVMAQQLPVDAWYPFSTQQPIRKCILYMMQSIAVFQTALNVSVDFTVATLFLYSTARLEMLKAKLDNISTENEVKLCIKTHQEIIEFVKVTQEAIVYIITKTNFTMACAVVFGGIPLIYDRRITVLIQFTTIIVASCQKLCVIAWPADDLSHISIGIAFAAYNAKWIKRSSTAKYNILFLMQRSQKPLVIRMSNFFPNLSLEYYANFLKTMMSYFMAMKAMIEHE